MRPISSGFAAIVCSTTILTAIAQNNAPPQPSQSRPIMATRLFTGPDGQSHIDQVAIATPDTVRAVSDHVRMSDAYIIRIAPGYFEPWHNADQRRYIVVISGEAEVTTTGGEKAQIVPGKIYIAEDLTGKGHTFKVVGNTEWVALFANFAK